MIPGLGRRFCTEKAEEEKGHIPSQLSQGVEKSTGCFPQSTHHQIYCCIIATHTHIKAYMLITLNGNLCFLVRPHCQLQQFSNQKSLSLFYFFTSVD